MKPYTHPHSKSLFVKFRHKGKVIQLDTKETNAERAQVTGWRMRVEWEERQKIGGYLTMQQVHDFDLARARDAGKDARYEKDEIGPHWRAIKEFFKSPGDLNYAALQRYVTHRRAETVKGKAKWSANTIMRHLRTLRRGLAEAKKHGHAVYSTDKDSWPKVGVEKGAKEDRRNSSNNIPFDVLIRFINTLEGHAFDHAVIFLCLGIRLSEAKKIDLRRDFTRCHDIPGIAGFLTIHGAKGKNDVDMKRDLAIPAGLYPVLSRAGRLDVDHRDVFKKALAKVGHTKGFNNRDFRAAFSSTLGPKNYPGTERALGHSVNHKANTAYWNWTITEQLEIARLVAENLLTKVNQQKRDNIEDISKYLLRRAKSKSGLKCI